jgi:hypothetical protein
MHALERACNGDLVTAGAVIRDCLMLRPRRLAGDLPVSETAYWQSMAGPLLLAPTPTRHAPAVRVVAVLDLDPAEVPADQRETLARDQHWIATTLAHSAADMRARRCPDELASLLASTDQPALLDAVRSASRDRLGPRLVQIVRTNPHLEPEPGGDDAVLAALTGRFEVIDTSQWSTAEALLTGAEHDLAPIAEACRAALRALPPGEAREYVCAVAQRGPRGLQRGQAVAAVTDAGYVPRDPADHPAFFFVTEQWEHYEAVDPDGQALYDTWTKVHQSQFPDDQMLCHAIEEIAEAYARPNPQDRWDEEHPVDLDPIGDPERPRGSYNSTWQTYGGGHFGI